MATATTTTDVVIPETAPLPALAPERSADVEVGFDDIDLPKITLLQSLSPLLQDNDDLRTGQVIWHTSGMGIHHLIGGDSGADKFTAYVVSRNKAVAEFPGDGSMNFLSHATEPDRNAEIPQWWVWFYNLVIPSISQVFPAKLMLTKMGLKCARQINTAIGLSPIGPNGIFAPTPITVRTVDATSKNGQRYKLLSAGVGTGTEEGYEVALRIQEFTVRSEQNRRAENAPPPNADDLPGM